MSIDELIEHLESLKRSTHGNRTVGVWGLDSTGDFHTLQNLAGAFTVYPTNDEDPRTGRGTGIGRLQTDSGPCNKAHTEMIRSLRQRGQDE